MKLIGPNKEWCRARRPFTGAWIETGMGYVFPGDRWVAPSRGRGLKRHEMIHVFDVLCRPFTGAWIETTVISLNYGPCLSPLHGGVD